MVAEFQFQPSKSGLYCGTPESALLLSEEWDTGGIMLRFPYGTGFIAMALATDANSRSTVNGF